MIKKILIWASLLLLSGVVSALTVRILRDAHGQNIESDLVQEVHKKGSEIIAYCPCPKGLPASGDVDCVISLGSDDFLWTLKNVLTKPEQKIPVKLRILLRPFLWAIKHRQSKKILFTCLDHIGADSPSFVIQLIFSVSETASSNRSMTKIVLYGLQDKPSDDVLEFSMRCLPRPSNVSIPLVWRGGAAAVSCAGVLIFSILQRRKQPGKQRELSSLTLEEAEFFFNQCFGEKAPEPDIPEPQDGKGCMKCYLCGEKSALCVAFDCLCTSVPGWRDKVQCYRCFQKLRCFITIGIRQSHIVILSGGEKRNICFLCRQPYSGGFLACGVCINAKSDCTCVNSPHTEDSVSSVNQKADLFKSFCESKLQEAC